MCIRDRLKELHCLQTKQNLELQIFREFTVNKYRICDKTSSCAEKTTDCLISFVQQTKIILVNAKIRLSLGKAKICTEQVQSISRSLNANISRTQLLALFGSRWRICSARQLDLLWLTKTDLSQQKNYCKYVLKEDIIDYGYRRCHRHSETIE